VWAIRPGAGLAPAFGAGRDLQASLLPQPPDALVIDRLRLAQQGVHAPRTIALVLHRQGLQARNYGRVIARAWLVVQQ
jgi:hypothetical protein